MSGAYARYGLWIALLLIVLIGLSCGTDRVVAPFADGPGGAVYAAEADSGQSNPRGKDDPEPMDNADQVTETTWGNIKRRYN